MIVKTVAELKAYLEGYPEDMPVHGFSGMGGCFREGLEVQGYVVKKIGSGNDHLIIAKNDPMSKSWKGKSSEPYNVVVID